MRWALSILSFAIASTAAAGCVPTVDPVFQARYVTTGSARLSPDLWVTARRAEARQNDLPDHTLVLQISQSGAFDQQIPSGSRAQLEIAGSRIIKAETWGDANPDRQATSTSYSRSVVTTWEIRVPLTRTQLNDAVMSGISEVTVDVSGQQITIPVESKIASKAAKKLACIAH